MLLESDGTFSVACYDEYIESSITTPAMDTDSTNCMANADKSSIGNGVTASDATWAPKIHFMRGFKGSGDS